MKASEFDCLLAILGVARMPAVYRRGKVYEVSRVDGNVPDGYDK